MSSRSRPQRQVRKACSLSQTTWSTMAWSGVPATRATRSTAQARSWSGQARVPCRPSLAHWASACWALRAAQYRPASGRRQPCVIWQSSRRRMARMPARPTPAPSCSSSCSRLSIRATSRRRPQMSRRRSCASSSRIQSTRTHTLIPRWPCSRKAASRTSRL